MKLMWMERGEVEQLPFSSRESFRTDYASWWDFAFSFRLYNLDLRSKAPWFQNLSRFGELMTVFLIPIHLILSFLLPEALYLFFYTSIYPVWAWEVCLVAFPGLEAALQKFLLLT